MTRPISVPPGAGDACRSVFWACRDKLCTYSAKRGVLERQNIINPPDRSSQALFPKDEALVEMAAQGYIAVPLSDRSGGVLGHLALIDVKPMPMAPRDLSVFITIFAARARAELERKLAEEARARSEERLSSVLASAMPAIITIDGERHITLFNPAAERVFGCAASWALGQPLDRFLSRRFRSLLEECIATGLWTPDRFPLEYQKAGLLTGPLFSGVIGASHNDKYVLLTEGSTPTPGLERLSEEGKPSPLDREIKAAIAAGTAGA